MIKRILILPCLILVFNQAIAKDNSFDSKIKNQIKSFTSGKIIPDSVHQTPVPGIYEIRAGLDVFYTDSTGQYAFVEGHLLDLKHTNDLTQQSLNQAATIDFKALPLKLALKTVRGNGKRVIAVFEDPNCPYCRAFRTLLNQLKDVTIYTFPYPILSNDSDRKAKAALCATDKVRAWDQLMLSGQTPETPPCETTIEKIIDLGSKLHVSSTPTVFFSNGQRSQGAIPPDQFMVMLEEASK